MHETEARRVQDVVFLYKIVLKEKNKYPMTSLTRQVSQEEEEEEEEAKTDQVS